MSYGYELRANRAASAAAIWAFVFAAISFYWAAGGTAGLSTLSPELLKMARDPWFIAIVWGTAILKVLAGLLVLALIQRWGRYLPQRFLLVSIWGMGIFMVLYGGANLIVRGLMALGILSTPTSMFTPAAWWHLLWDLWWLAGGLLFCAAARSARSQHRRINQ